MLRLSNYFLIKNSHTVQIKDVEKNFGTPSNKILILCYAVSSLISHDDAEFSIIVQFLIFIHIYASNLRIITFLLDLVL